MEYVIELIQQQALPTLSVRRRAGVQDLPAVLGQSYGEIMTGEWRNGFWSSLCDLFQYGYGRFGC